MADQSHLEILLGDAYDWSSWRKQNRSIEPDLSGADLSGAALPWTDFRKTNLSGANLSGANLASAFFLQANLQGANLQMAELREARFPMANLQMADLWEADLTSAKLDWAQLQEARLTGANLHKANLEKANLTSANLQVAQLQEAKLTEANLTSANLFAANLYKADLEKAILQEADLHGAWLWRADLTLAKLQGANLHDAGLTEARMSFADLTGANLSDALLSQSVLVQTNLERATLTGCKIYGISAWGLRLEGAKQQNLNVSGALEPDIMVDNIEVGQFIYLLLRNEKIRQVIDTITSKVVLILGRFTEERKEVLDAIRDSLRQRDYLPVLFDFDKPASRDLTETISTLAHMARFIIADITDAKSIPQELQAIVPNLPSVPVQPLVLASDYEYGMFEHFKRYPWVLAVHVYENPQEVLASLEAKIISPAEVKARELSR